MATRPIQRRWNPRQIPFLSPSERKLRNRLLIGVVLLVLTVISAIALGAIGIKILVGPLALTHLASFLFALAIIAHTDARLIPERPETRNYILTGDVQWCPVCGYDLHATPPPHPCPECGSTLSDHELRQAWLDIYNQVARADSK